MGWLRRSVILLSVLMAAASSSRGDEPSRPVVVLIGDSIRLGYAPVVAERLKGMADVISPTENGGDSRNVLAHLGEWAIRTKPAVVHVNAGLHDLKIDPKTGAHQVELDAYRENLKAIVERLEKATSARLILATTTPVLGARHNATKPFQRREIDVRAYNASALAVAGASPHVTIDDLHACAERLGRESALAADGVHFTKDAYGALGAHVAAEITRALTGVPATRNAVCRWTTVAPTIDGKVDEPAWSRAQVIEQFPAFWRSDAGGSGTQAYLLWDDRALYFAAKMTDSAVRSYGARRNDKLWLGDVFELFFKPAQTRPEYYEFQANPKSLILEMAIPRRGFDFHVMAAKPPLGMEAVAVVDGTPDRPGDRDRGWTVEGCLPWSAFAPTGGRPASGAEWAFALCRYDYGPEKSEPVLMSTAPLRRRSFHRYEDYGCLNFEGPPR